MRLFAISCPFCFIIFLLFSPALANAATLSGQVWEDVNGNGVQSAGEFGIDGVTLELLDNGGSVVQTTSSAGGGVYSFTIATAGNYSVRVTPPAGYALTTQDAGADDTIDSDFSQATGETAQISVAVSDAIINIDAGLVLSPGIIGVSKVVTSITPAGGGQYDIAFSFVVENLGTVALTNVNVVDDLTSTFPAPVTYSIQAGPASTGTLTANAGFNGDADQNLLNAAASSLAIGATGAISFTVRIDPNGQAGPFLNTAMASGEEPGGIVVTDLSDDGVDPDPNGNGDPKDPGEDDETPITIALAALQKTSALLADADSSGDLTAGDTVRYTIMATNSGTGDATSVVLADSPDANTALVAGSVTTSQGTVVTGNTGGDIAVSVDVGTISSGGGTATVTFDAVIDDPLPGGTYEISNQATISGTNINNDVSDDPGTGTASDATVDQVKNLALGVAVTGSGTVTSDVGAIHCPGTCSDTYFHGDTVTLTAAAGLGHSFGSWSGCDATSGNQCTVNMDGAKSVTAAFIAVAPAPTLSEWGVVLMAVMLAGGMILLNRRRQNSF